MYLIRLLAIAARPTQAGRLPRFCQPSPSPPHGPANSARSARPPPSSAAQQPRRGSQHGTVSHMSEH